MKLTFEPTRLTGLAILAVAGATALSVGACSSSKDSKSTETSSPASANANANANAKDEVYGLIASVSGNAVQVTQTNGTATVDVGPKTKVNELTKAQLSDVAAGNCVNVTAKPAPAAGGAATAILVQLSPQGGDGKCPQPKNARPREVIGTVASVAGNSINVSVTDASGNPAETNLTLINGTQYRKRAPREFAGHRAGQVHHRTGEKGW